MCLSRNLSPCFSVRYFDAAVLYLVLVGRCLAQALISQSTAERQRHEDYLPLTKKIPDIYTFLGSWNCLSALKAGCYRVNFLEISKQKKHFSF